MIGRYTFADIKGSKIDNSAEFNGDDFGYIKNDSIQYNGWIEVVKIKDGEPILRFEIQNKIYHVVSKDITEFGLYKDDHYGMVSDNSLKVKYVKKIILFKGSQRLKFLKELYKGKVSLYEYDNGVRSFLYLEKGEEILALLNEEQKSRGVSAAEELVRVMLSDSQFKDKYLENYTFSKYYFKGLVRNYSENSSYRIPLIHLSGFAGFAVSEFVNEDPVYNSALKEVCFVNSGFFKVGFRMKFPLINSSRLMFKTGLGVSRGKAEVNSIHLQSVNPDEYRINMNMPEIPIGLEYNLLPQNWISPYIAADLLLGFNFLDEGKLDGLISHDFDFLISQDSGDVVIFQPSIGLSAGLNLKIGKKSYLFAESSFQKSFSGMPSFTQYGVNLGMCFRY